MFVFAVSITRTAYRLPHTCPSKLVVAFLVCVGTCFEARTPLAYACKRCTCSIAQAVSRHYMSMLRGCTYIAGALLCVGVGGRALVFRPLCCTCTGCRCTVAALQLLSLFIDVYASRNIASSVLVSSFCVSVWKELRPEGFVLLVCCTNARTGIGTV